MALDFFWAVIWTGTASAIAIVIDVQIGRRRRGQRQRTAYHAPRMQKS